MGAAARAVQGRSSAGPRGSAAAWGCAGVQQRGDAKGRSMWLRMGAAAWGCAGAQQRGATQGRSSVGLRRGAAAWGCRVG